MDGQKKPLRLVVANTGPIVAALLANCLELLPQIFARIHIPQIEFEEWLQTLAAANRKLPANEQVEIQTLLGTWTQRGILVLHELTLAQEMRAQNLTARIHPDYVEQGKLAVDGAAIVLARTLVDLGEAQFLLADERRLRQCAREEGVDCIGSIWMFIRMFELGVLDFQRASEAPARARGRGQHYSANLISGYRLALERLRDARA